MDPVSSARMRRRLAFCGIALFAIAIAGCAAKNQTTPPPKATSPPAAGSKPRPKAGYDHRVDDLASIDSTALTGRRIALDPGHGGIFRGALGAHGLTEAEVNLGVALNLRGLLEGRGATVFMTRTDDRDFLTPSDSTLRGDLAARIQLANQFHPDLFVSIHHNADARGAHDVNETQTYYKLGDEGPSLDAAQDVHRYLVRNLGIEQHRILPGNYFVLRNSEAPGILTESSYITNPDVEAQLVLASKQRLEAEALLLGLARYFARRAPEIAELTARADSATAPDTSFREIGAPLLRARIAGAFDVATLDLDGARLDGVRRGDLVEWRPAPLDAGTHEAVLTARLSGAGAARERTLRFTVTRAPAMLAAQLLGRTRDGVAALRIAVLDRIGRPCLDSIAVRVVARGAKPPDTTVAAIDGVAWAYPRIATAQRKVTATVSIAAPSGSRGASPKPLTIDLAAARAENGWSGFALRMPEAIPLAGALGTSGPAPRIGWINRDGFVHLDDRRDDHVAPDLPGYRPWGSDTLPPRFVPIAGGALQGKRIVIDPDGGGDDAAGTGKSGTRAAGINLEVARALGGMLAGAGADVRLTREGDYALSDVERVQISEAFHADRFLRIGHRAESARLGYYFSSAAGKRWAEATSREMSALGLPTPPLAEDAQYPLQQTSCPALYVSPARLDDAGQEGRLLAPGTLRTEAYSLYLGLAREWAPTAEWPRDSLTVRDSAGTALAGAAVTLGGSLVLETDARGRIRYARTEPGPIEAEVQHRRLRSRTILLESERGTVLTGSRSR